MGKRVKKHSAVIGAEREGEGCVWKDEDDEQLEIAVPNKVKKTFKVDLKRQNDDDDKDLSSKEYIGRLQEAFKRRHGGTPKWASKATEDEEDENSLLKSAAGYLEKDVKLSKSTIHTTLLKDFNIGHRSTKPIRSLRFHKTRPILITADSSGSVKLYKVGSEVNTDTFLQSARFSKFPIDCMEIGQQGHAVICSTSSKEYLMQYNMDNNEVTQMRLPLNIPKQGISHFAISHDSQFIAIAGANSHVYVLHALTMELVKTVALPGNAKQIKFFPGVSRELWIICENGQIVVADIKSVSQHTFHDDGAVHGTCLAISNSGDYLATGSDTGIVNVYDGASCRQSSTPSPLFNVDNLVTSVSAIAFNSDAQLLAVCSNVKENQVRLVHTQSQTTFKNFPERHGKVSKARCVEFSPKGGYMAVGNEDGKLHVFNIHHFGQY